MFNKLQTILTVIIVKIPRCVDHKLLLVLLARDVILSHVHLNLVLKAGITIICNILSAATSMRHTMWEILYVNFTLSATNLNCYIIGMFVHKSEAICLVNTFITVVAEICNLHVHDLHGDLRQHQTIQVARSV